MADKDKIIDLSIIIPAYNEEKNISLIYSRIVAVLRKLKLSYEIIFVDDGSTDKTFDQIRKIANSDSNIRAIQFQRNYEKAAALSCGFNESKGEIVITMDADLQDDPVEIPRFIKKLNEGYDIVSGWKFHRHDPITKTIPSKFFNFITRKLTKIDIHDFNCGFKAYRREVVKTIKLHGELHRYIPVLGKWNGYKTGEIKVTHHARQFGKSKYGASRLFKGFLDLITVNFLINYSKRPMHLFGLLGLFLSFLGFLTGLLLLYDKLNGIAIGNRPLLILFMLLILMGLQFFSIGLLGETITFSKEEKYNIRQKL